MDNKEKNEALEEMITEDNSNSEVVETVINNEEVLVELEEEEVPQKLKEKKVLGTGGKIIASVIDQIVVAAISLIGMVVFDLLIRLIGFYVAERLPMYFIFFAIGNVFYPVLCDLLKLKKTYGYKIMGAE